jgi:hypothetical protein
MENLKNIQNLENKKSKAKFFVAGALAMIGTSAMATTTVNNGSFEQLMVVFSGWLQGALGKLLALLGFIGTFIIYLMTHKGSVLFVGILISLIAGGIVGISETFFNIGNSSFTVV